MFRRFHRIRLCSTLAVGLTAMAAWAPSALATCSCMCVDATPYYVCTGFVSTQEQTAECDLLECPSVSDTTPTADPAPVEDPLALESPHPGLECDRRSVYRPDLGRYKQYKVCKPSADAEHRSNHENSGKNEEAWVARRERMQDTWETQMARYQEHHDDD